jgi:maleylacetoacetate isomerase
MSFTLYSYFRSSAAYRVRIALELKGLDYRLVPVHLLGEQLKPNYAAINPQKLVPALLDGDAVLTQSPAILEYLDEVHPKPSILPAGPRDRAFVRAIAMAICCDIHPLNNLRVLQRLENVEGRDIQARHAWYRHWVGLGLEACEALLARHAGRGTFCHGEAPTIADICLVPQIYNAVRYECPLEAYPIIRSINAACLALPAFRKAAPDAQPDAPPQ